MSDAAMNRVSVDVEDIDGRPQVVLTVEDVDSGLRMETIFPTITNVHRLARQLVAAADEIDEGDHDQGGM